MPQHRISVCLEPSENAKHSYKTSFCESLELEYDQIEKLENIFNSEDLSFLSRLEQLICEYKSIQNIPSTMPSRLTQNIVDKYHENTHDISQIGEESESAIIMEQKRLEVEAEIFKIIDEPDTKSEVSVTTGENTSKNHGQIEFDSEGEIVLSDYSLESDSSDAEIEVLEDRLSERTDSKFDDNTRNSISSETSSFEVIRTPRDNLPPRSKPISTPVSPSKENPVSSTPRGSKEFPNLAVKFPVQPPELPKSCGWKQKKYTPGTSYSSGDKGESVPNLVSDNESENEFENIKTVEKVPFYNKGNQNDQKKSKRESTRGIRGRKRNQMLRRANEHGSYIDSKGQEQKRK